MRELLLRLQAESPNFFKKVRKLALSVSAGIGAVLMAQAQLTIPLPADLVKYLGWIMCICAGIGAASFLPVKDNEDIKPA